MFEHMDWGFDGNSIRRSRGNQKSWTTPCFGNTSPYVDQDLRNGWLHADSLGNSGINGLLLEADGMDKIPDGVDRTHHRRTLRHRRHAQVPEIATAGRTSSPALASCIAMSDGAMSGGGRAH